ncbi:DUF2911 domain-containing protein [Mesoterricola silvestris]|uniref:DUF2911 domain-containing protein n=1 Tax=Mesoterricola silvestris TaxID=2927979 RepID=A0AA48GXP3_9BACT|nr:DUF2911 domain-containing protein [Mesoterricola silvestris]BDU73786.1 hypothetical protein METEAL_29600 [Mesoterricola silvestris]
MRSVILSAAFAAALSLPAQQTMVKPYQPSPGASVTQTLGISTVKIDYSRPGVKGRKIWGGLVPFGEVWRAGANNATVITFSDPVKIAGKDLAAGSYAFFAIPGPKAWTLIFNRNAKQWGAYDHKASEDALRLEVVPATLAVPEEYLNFSIHLASLDSLRVELAWEKVSVGFDVTLDTPGLYWAYLEKTLAGARADEHIPFLQGARYCLTNNVHLDKGREWIDRSLKAKEVYSNLDTKARYLAKDGKKAEALATLQKAMDLAAAAKAPQEYLDGLAKTRAEWAAR